MHPRQLLLLSRAVNLFSLVLLLVNSSQSNGGIGLVQADSAASYYGKLVSNIKGSVSQQLQNFNEYKTLFHKTYRSSLEEAVRQKIFIASQIRAALSKVNYFSEKSNSYLSINDMSDWSQSEFGRILSPHDEKQKRIEESDRDVAMEAKLIDRKKHGGHPVETQLHSKPPPDTPNKLDSNESDSAEKSHAGADLLGTPPTEINSAAPGDQNGDVVHHDLRRSGCIGPVKDLKTCNGCFVFSTLALYEYMHCMSTKSANHNNRPVQFSEQFVIDCGHTVGIKGCSGGKEVFVAYFVSLFGLIREDEYPFVGRANKCPYKREFSTLEPNLPTISKVQPREFAKLLASTPILAAVHISPTFRDYGGGIDDSNCEPLFGHGMLLVGDGSENGIDYWLYKNSWGATWGEKGYYRLAKRSNCSHIDGGIGYAPKAYLEGKRVKFAQSQLDGAELLEDYRTNVEKPKSFFGKLFG